MSDEIVFRVTVSYTIGHLWWKERYSLDLNIAVDNPFNIHAEIQERLYGYKIESLHITQMRSTL